LLTIDATLGYPGFPVLPDFHWEVGSGEFVLLLGSNGSGKTTVLRSCAGVIVPRSGEVLINGRRATDNISKKHIGYLSDPPPFYEELTPQEHCELVQRLWGTGVRPDRIDEMVEEFRLQSFFHQRCDSLSLGMRKRLSLALAFLHEPDILLFDEPYNGLDLRSSQTLTSLITAVVTHGGCCVLSTHQPQHLLEHATRITVLYESSIVYDRSPEGWDPYEWGFVDLPSDSPDDDE